MKHSLLMLPLLLCCCATSSSLRLIESLHFSLEKNEYVIFDCVIDDETITINILDHQRRLVQTVRSDTHLCSFRKSGNWIFMEFDGAGTVSTYRTDDPSIPTLIRAHFKKVRYPVTKIRVPEIPIQT